MLLDAYLYKPNVSEINNNEYVYNFKFDSNQFGVNNDFMCLNGTILEKKP